MEGEVIKGYLKYSTSHADGSIKGKKMQYFVLCKESNNGHARLEVYKNEKSKEKLIPEYYILKSDVVKIIDYNTPEVLMIALRTNTNVFLSYKEDSTTLRTWKQKLQEVLVKNSTTVENDYEYDFPMLQHFNSSSSLEVSSLPKSSPPVRELKSEFEIKMTPQTTKQLLKRNSKLKLKKTELDNVSIHLFMNHIECKASGYVLLSFLYTDIKKKKGKEDSIILLLASTYNLDALEIKCDKVKDLNFALDEKLKFIDMANKDLGISILTESEKVALQRSKISDSSYADPDNFGDNFIITSRLSTKSQQAEQPKSTSKEYVDLKGQILLPLAKNPNRVGKEPPQEKVSNKTVETDYENTRPIDLYATIIK